MLIELIDFSKNEFKNVANLGASVRPSLRKEKQDEDGRRSLLVNQSINNNKQR
jgi:hypothetical protein